MAFPEYLKLNQIEKFFYNSMLKIGLLALNN